MSLPNYDIVAMLEVCDPPEKLLFSMWERLSPSNYGELFEEEKVVLDAWNFDSAFGNGINDLLANENYDIIANGLRAMRVLGLPRLREFVATMESVFASFGVNCASGDDIAKVEGLSVSQRERLHADLDTAEGPYLREFWETGVLALAAKDYLMNNLGVFKRRKQGD